MMGILVNLEAGLFLGFFLGIGCSLAVIYAIYLGGYRKAIEDSLREPQPENYSKLLLKAKKSLASSIAR
jgi:hypothetical protein